MGRPQKRKTDAEYRDKLLSRLDIRGEDECWEYKGSRTQFGYGVFSIRSRTMNASRAMWMLENGPIARGMYVCHHCDNPPCCNPKHLYVGTARENVQDMLQRGRNVNKSGIENGNHRRAVRDLGRYHVSKTVDAFRMRAVELGMTQSDVARVSGIDPSRISAFWRGESGLNVAKIDILLDCLGMEIRPKQPAA